MCKLIAVTGGIGSGKSVVCAILAAMGYDVYDCDSRAKSIMDSSLEIKQFISDEICKDAIVGTRIDRSVLAKKVFNDECALARLNSVVHKEVKRDIISWSKGKRLAFVETAILYQSGIDRMVGEVWQVDAPVGLRVERVKRRNNLPESEIMRRIDVQDGFVPAIGHNNVVHLINDNAHPVLPQVELLLK